MRPKNYWRSSQNQRGFLLSIAKEFDIKSDKEWGNLSNYQLLQKGGASLLRYSGNSIFALLKKVFPGSFLHLNSNFKKRIGKRPGSINRYGNRTKINENF